MPPAPSSRAPARTGVCRAIFAVTGVTDDVSDLILPGAFAHTLATRPVKTVWHHDWKEPVGVVLDIAEWAPGDPRFADIPNWPAQAGALVATIQFNLRTSRGRDVYEQVKQWHQHGEAQFSIGYQVPPGGATKRADGVRVISKLTLYEVSPVLHGAHPMTMALEVKSAVGTADLERKITSSAAIDIKAAEPYVGRGAMVALYLPADIASAIAHPDGTEPHDLHITLAYLGSADTLPGRPDDLAHTVAAALSGAAPLTGKIGGIGRFPSSGDGEPVFVPVDVPGLSELRQQITGALSRTHLAGALHTEHDFTPHITLGYDLPAGTPAVPATPIAFDTVHVVRGPDSVPIRLTEPVPETGAASSGPAGPTVRASVEAKTARAAVLEGKAITGTTQKPAPGRRPGNSTSRPLLRSASGTSARAAVLEAKTASGAPMPLHPLPASYEDIRDRVGAAVRGLLADGPAWTCVEATYPDRVIVSLHRDGAEPTTYSVPYDSTGSEISLGQPEPVELTTIVLTPDQVPARAADSSETAEHRVVQPTTRHLADATALIQAAPAEHLGPVRTTVADLLSALSTKGIDLTAEDERERPVPAPSPMAGSGIDLWDDDPYDEPEGELGDDYADDEDEDGADDGNTVRLGHAEVEAQLAAIRG
ncbi:2'-5' RNA ligase family protein [Streptomyces tsukubensis]